MHFTRVGRNAEIFDVRMGRDHQLDGERCHGVYFRTMTYNEIRAIVEAEMPLPTLACWTCEAESVMTADEFARVLEEIGVTLREASRDAFKLAYIYQESLQIAKAQSHLNECDLWAKEKVAYEIQAIRQQVKDLHERQFGRLS